MAKKELNFEYKGYRGVARWGENVKLYTGWIVCVPTVNVFVHGTTAIEVEKEFKKEVDNLIKSMEG